MKMKVSLSRKWLMAAGVLFLAAACQPKETQEQQQPRESYSRSSQDGGSCTQDCQKKDCCPEKECPTDCKKECPKENPKECPKKEPCKTDCPCPEKECPCPQEDCSSCDTGCCVLEPKKESTVTQSPVRVEAKVEAPAAAKPVVVKEGSTT